MSKDINKYFYLFLNMVITTLDIENKDYLIIKNFCKRHGFTLKGILVKGAKQIIEEDERRTNLS